MGPDPWAGAAFVFIVVLCAVSAVSMAVAAMRGDVGQGVYDQEADHDVDD